MMTVQLMCGIELISVKDKEKALGCNALENETTVDEANAAILFIYTSGRRQVRQQEPPALFPTVPGHPGIQAAAPYLVSPANEQRLAPTLEQKWQQAVREALTAACSVLLSFPSIEE